MSEKNTREVKVEEYKAKKSKFTKSIDQWTEKEKKEHFKKLEYFYSRTSQHKKNMLGDFSHDTEHRYYWTRIDDQADAIERRKSIGWGFASKDDAEKAHISRRTQDAELLGETCVVADHGDCQAVLMKCPIEIAELNDQAREQLNASKPLLDNNGKPVKFKMKIQGDSVVRTRIDEEINESNI